MNVSMYCCLKSYKFISYFNNVQIFVFANNLKHYCQFEQQGTQNNLTLYWTSAQSFEIIYCVAHETDHLFGQELSAHVDSSTYWICYIKVVYRYDINRTFFKSCRKCLSSLERFEYAQVLFKHLYCIITIQQNRQMTYEICQCRLKSRPKKKRWKKLQHMQEMNGWCKK